MQERYVIFRSSRHGGSLTRVPYRIFHLRKETLLASPDADSFHFLKPKFRSIRAVNNSRVIDCLLLVYNTHHTALSEGSFDLAGAGGIDASGGFTGFARPSAGFGRFEYLVGPPI